MLYLYSCAFQSQCCCVCLTATRQRAEFMFGLCKHVSSERTAELSRKNTVTIFEIVISTYDMFSSLWSQVPRPGEVNMFTASFFLGCQQHSLFQGETKHPRSICFDEHRCVLFQPQFQGEQEMGTHRLTGLACAFSRSHPLQFMQTLYGKYCVFFQLKHQLRTTQHIHRKSSLLAFLWAHRPNLLFTESRV